MSRPIGFYKDGRGRTRPITSESAQALWNSASKVRVSGSPESWWNKLSPRQNQEMLSLISADETLWARNWEELPPNVQQGLGHAYRDIKYGPEYGSD